MGGLHIGDITITKVEDFLNLGEGVTLKDFLLSDEIKGITVEQMIAALLSSNIEIKQGDIKNFISTMSATLKTVTFTEIIANSQDIEVAKFNSIYKTFVEGYKNILSNILAISVSVDKDGKFVSYNTTVTFGAETVKAIEDWAAKLSKIDSEMTLNENVLKSLARVEVGVSINFTKGKLVSDFDYKAFVEGFDATDEPA